MELIHCIYEPAGEGPHPTIFALHGWGANALDLLGLAPHIAGGRFRLICPQGPLQTPIGPGMIGYGWFPLRMGGETDVGAIIAAREQLRQFLDVCMERYEIDARKLVVLGFSQGGGMAYSLGLSQPERFVGMCVLSSWLREEMLAQFEVGEGVNALSTLVQHGVRDELIELTRAEHSIELLKKLEVPVDYKPYNMGHEISSQSLGDLSSWLESKVLTSPILL
jgi:phospholipase/carboxylesterase